MPDTTNAWHGLRAVGTHSAEFICQTTSMRCWAVWFYTGYPGRAEIREAEITSDGWLGSPVQRALVSLEFQDA